MTSGEQDGIALTESMNSFLSAMPPDQYYNTMFRICMEIQKAYQLYLSEADKALTDRTLDFLSKRSAHSGSDKEPAIELSRAWNDLLDQPDEDGPSGWFAAMYTFSFLIGELAGELPQRVALEYLSQAAKELPPLDAQPIQPRLVLLRSDAPPAGPEAAALLQRLEKLARTASQ